MSTTEIIDEKIKILKYEFTNISKRIIKRDASSNILTLHKNRDLLIEAYNKFLDFSETIYGASDEQIRLKINDTFNYYRDKVIQAFTILRCNYKIPNKLFTRIDSNITSNDFTEPESGVEMATPNLDYIKLANNILKPYNGKPDGLSSFINCLDLLATITTTEHVPLAVCFVKTRLEGRALECLPTNCTSIDDIKSSLTKHIKPTSSKLLESQLSTINASKKTLQEFSSEIDKIAALLRQSLINEGCSSTKAEELVTSKVVDICRTSAQSDFIKTVLASSTFSNYQDVLNKYCLESTCRNQPSSPSVLTMYATNRMSSPQNNTRPPRYQSNFTSYNPNLGQRYRHDVSNTRSFYPRQNTSAFRNQFPNPNQRNPFTNNRYNNFSYNNRRRESQRYNQNHGTVHYFQNQGNVQHPVTEAREDQQTLPNSPEY